MHMVTILEVASTPKELCESVFEKPLEGLIPLLHFFLLKKYLFIDHSIHHLIFSFAGFLLITKHHAFAPFGENT
ncbi:hypothetical protein TanjilG_08552 [Lupinus angustifolius]|uniref:Uncharacterized protein n=1 Tax=Lupinus angustifolius TaxID=3871 RepID=A0A1J7HZ88_LUPAN|nr:hypothetical protein TanjilG_08552 [Lupinus angustifolius]